ncbi:hypothetical protein EHQ13_16460 [Leptospira gomenensis]|uniref:AAA+ ATPase domain-containing protein n=1 Tax=Leptospira gomenensis TaxID=2484974 RepID=A0A5F1YIV8_9LEPT|nr:AAA family ATPase [Leptospira gomenensis]TGK38493.1 hypothetical protein EHQ17_02345 [Leptospira gomenensis]TGK42608.1 hypothetical protein EHQ07_14440 [Leptospira gomenensis]TGK55856.1 hypothetical protein EHQ13_16460 [Leptospira gomenensis]
MNIDIKIKDLKGIEDLSISLPLSPGLYAITGGNGSGKSTLMAALANLFYKDILKNYFKYPSLQASIEYKYGDIEEIWSFSRSDWSVKRGVSELRIDGFFEGSVIHGNRFKDTHYSTFKKIEQVEKTDLVQASPFIKDNFGYILHGYEDYYKQILQVDKYLAGTKYRFASSPYFVEGKRGLISQFELSSGENLILSLLNSLEIKIKKKFKQTTSLILIDEVELALHPSSILRLLNVLNKIAVEKNFAIYFSTHSIELIRTLQYENIFYLENEVGSVSVTNPCYPAYATRSLFYHDGFDYLILVEDILAKRIIERLINDERLYVSKLIHVLPLGGWSNVLSVQDEIQRSSMLGYKKKLFCILDGDIAPLVKEKHIDKGQYKGLKLNPIIPNRT